MTLSELDLDLEVVRRLRALIAKEAGAQFAGVVELTSETRLEERIVRCLEQFRRDGLDWKAAALALSWVRYFTDAEINDLWHSVGGKVEAWLNEQGLRLWSDQYLLQVRGESHIEAIFRARGWPGYLEPLVNPRPDHVEHLWERVQGLVGGRDNRLHRDEVRTIDERAAWILLWDLNLSGKTVAKEIERVQRLMRSLPSATPRRCLVASLLQTRAARERVSQGAAELGLPVSQVTVLEPRETVLGGDWGPTDVERARIEDFCRAFHDSWIAPDQARDLASGKAKPRLRSVGPLGYDNGGWFLTRQANSPNNSLPFLWFVSRDEARPYVGPFPRKPSRLEHESTADDTLNKATARELDECSAALAYYLEVPRPRRRVPTPPVAQWSQDVDKAMSLVTETGNPDSLGLAHACAQRLIASDPQADLNSIAAAHLVLCEIAHARSDTEGFWASWKDLGRLMSEAAPATVRARHAQLARVISSRPVGTALPVLELPLSRYSDHGPPADLALRRGREPLTTRAASAAALRARIASLLATKKGAVVVLPGAPGAGKSVYARLALEGASFPTLHVELDDVETPGQVADALLRGSWVDDETARQARSPQEAAEQLDRLLGSRPTAIVIEQAGRTASGRVARGLDAAVRSLVRRRHVLLVESWTIDPTSIRDVEPAALERTLPLVSLADDEILAWTTAELGRPDEAVASGLSLFEDNPRMMGEVLRSLANEPPADEDEMNEQLLSAAQHWKDEDFERFITHDQVPPVDLIGEHLACWFATLPWAVVPRSILDGSDRDRLQRLKLSGVVRRNEDGSYEAGAWACALGLRRVAADPGILAVAVPLLARLAPCVPQHRLRQARRHVAALLSRFGGTSGHTPLAALLTTLPAPPPLESAEHNEGTRRDVSLVLDPSAAKYPADVIVEALTGASRGGDLATAQALVGQLASLPAADGAGLIRDWSTLKSLHIALARLPAPPQRRVALYELVVQRLEPALREESEQGTLEPASRAWALRLLAAAASSALEALRLDLSEAWLLIAAEHQRRLERPRAGSMARFVYDDTAYRLADARCAAGRSLPGLLERHTQALATVPGIEEQSLERRELWGRRVLRHLKPLLRAGGPAVDEHVSRLRSTLASLPPTLGLFRQLRRYRRDAGELPREVGPLLDELLLQKEKDLRRTRSDPRLLELAQLVRGATGTVEAQVRTVRDVASRSQAWLEPVDAEILDAALSLLLGRKDEVAREERRREMAEACELVLEQLMADPTPDESTRMPRRHCLALLAQHYLAPARDARDARRHDRGWTGPSGRNARWRIDKTYRRHAETGTDPWLWFEWAEAAIDLVQTHALEQDDPDGTDCEVGAYLDEVGAHIERAIGEHAAGLAALLRLRRYRFDFEASVKLAERLQLACVEGRERLRVVRLLSRVLGPLVLEPPGLREWTPEAEVQERVTKLYRDVLSEERLAVGRPAAAAWADAALAVLDGTMSPERWGEIATELRQRMGDPEDYWQLAAGPQALHADAGTEHALSALMGDLTDSNSLVLGGRLLRRGASDPALALDLRKALADIAVMASSHAYRWERSTRRRPSASTELHLAYAIGTALALSPTRLIYGHASVPPPLSVRGKSKTWEQFMLERLQSLSGRSVGRFRGFVERVTQTLSKGLGDSPRAAGHA